jgi:hypothetical protein
MINTDPTTLSLDDLREQRSALQQQDDAVSFVRRVAQARLDLITEEQRRRTEGAPAIDLGQHSDELGAILSTHLTGGAPRPPRPADDFSDHPLAVELEELCNEAGTDLRALSDDELEAYKERLSGFERLRSDERRALFADIDELSAELVRRYREGEADVDGLLAADD